MRVRSFKRNFLTTTVAVVALFTFGAGNVDAASKAPSEPELRKFYKSFHDTLHNDFSKHVALLKKHLNDKGAFEISVVMKGAGHEFMERFIRTKAQLIADMEKGHAPGNTYSQKILSVEYNAAGTLAIVKDVMTSQMKTNFPNPMTNKTLTITIDQTMHCTTDVARNSAGDIEIQKGDCHSESTMKGDKEAQLMIDMIMKQKKAQ